MGTGRDFGFLSVSNRTEKKMGKRWVHTRHFGSLSVIKRAEKKTGKRGVKDGYEDGYTTGTLFFFRINSKLTKGWVKDG